MDELATQWQKLEEDALHSYFLSWGWISTWLTTLPDSIRPIVLTAKYNGNLVGLALIVFGKQSRRGLLVPSNIAVVNETGLPYYDHLVIEYNEFLVAEKYLYEVSAAFVGYLLDKFNNWNEIIIRAVDSNSPLTDPGLYEKYQLNLKVNNDTPSWYVDLHELRDEGVQYLDCLSRNTRYQIRRAIRECEKRGSIELSAARSTKEAKEFLYRLAEFHQISWNSKGQPGCFSNQFFIDFHRLLIERRFDHGEIQFLRICIDEAELGYLYNFVKDDCVYYYQSGFNYEMGEKLKPGLISHCKAIQYNLEQGRSVYDFLASKDRYKRSLATNSNSLLDVSLQKLLMRYKVEDGVNRFIESCKDIIRYARKLN